MYYLINAYLGMNRYSDVIRFALDALETWHEAKDFHLLLAHGYFGLKDYEKALPEYEKVLDICPNSTEVYSLF